MKKQNLNRAIFILRSFPLQEGNPAQKERKSKRRQREEGPTAKRKGHLDFAELLADEWTNALRSL